MAEGCIDYWHSEQLVLCRDDELGLRAAIAINDTTLGPGLGGVRCVRYPSDAAAITEAQRLAAAMTLKNAFAGLPYGGAKSVIEAPGARCRPPRADAALRRVRDPHRRRVPAGCRHGHERRGPPGDGGHRRRRLLQRRGSRRRGRRSAWPQRSAPRSSTSTGARASRARRVLIQGAGHVGAALARDLAG